MNNLIDEVKRVRHLSISLYKELSSLWVEMEKEVKAGKINDLTDFELVRGIMMLFAVSDGIALEAQDVYLALGTLCIKKHGMSFLNKIQEDMKNRSKEDMLVCECAECSTAGRKASDDVIKQAKDIMDKVLKEEK